MKTIELYCDGACSGNPGPGGWGAILIYGNHEKELSGYASDTTNNRMELTAAIMGLSALKEPCSVNLYTDSAYLHNAFTKGWTFAWERNGWQSSKKTEVENKDLWTTLINHTKGHHISWHKVKGHSDNVFNNRCDKLAKEQIKQHASKS